MKPQPPLLRSPLSVAHSNPPLSAITIVADWISEKGRKRFIARQRRLLKEAREVAERMRRMQSEHSGCGAFNGGMEEETEEEGAEISSEAVKEMERHRRRHSAQRMWRILRALRLTGVFFLLCLLLGELENSYVASW